MILLDEVINHEIINAISNGFFFSCDLESYGKASDVFWMSNSDNMDIVCDTYNELDNFAEQAIDFHLHSLYKHIFETKMADKWLQYSFRIALNRCRRKCFEKKNLSNIFD